MFVATLQNFQLSKQMTSPYRHHRAVVLSPSLTNNEDVLPVNVFNPGGSSSYPFGIIIRRKGTLEQYHPVVYVSERVASIRSTQRDAFNPPGVVQGWYVIGKPEYQFEILVTLVNSTCFPCERRRNHHRETDDTNTDNAQKTNRNTEEFNVVRGRLYLDGKPTNDIFDATKHVLERDFISTGFTTAQRFTKRNRFSKVVRPFQFQKAVVSDDNSVDENVNVQSSLIQLKVSRAIAKNPNRVLTDINKNLKQVRRGDVIIPKSLKQRGRRVASKVSQEQAHKDGKTLKAGPSLNSERGKGIHVLSVVYDEKPWPEADIELKIREEDWMISRRLVDENLHACTHSEYLRRLNADKEKARAGAEADVEAEGAGEIKVESEGVKIEEEEVEVTFSEKSDHIISTYSSSAHEAVDRDNTADLVGIERQVSQAVKPEVEIKAESQAEGEGEEEYAAEEGDNIIPTNSTMAEEFINREIAEVIGMEIQDLQPVKSEPRSAGRKSPRNSTDDDVHPFVGSAHGSKQQHGETTTRKRRKWKLLGHNWKDEPKSPVCAFIDLT